jgi:hypothetical protein
LYRTSFCTRPRLSRARANCFFSCKPAPASALLGLCPYLSFKRGRSTEYEPSRREKAKATSHRTLSSHIAATKRTSTSTSALYLLFGSHLLRKQRRHSHPPLFTFPMGTSDCSFALGTFPPTRCTSTSTTQHPYLEQLRRYNVSGKNNVAREPQTRGESQLNGRIVLPSGLCERDTPCPATLFSPTSYHGCGVEIGVLQR